MMKLLEQINTFEEVMMKRVAEGYVVEINDTEGMPLALDELLDELEKHCLGITDGHEFGYSFVFDGFEVAILFVGDYD